MNPASATFVPLITIDGPTASGKGTIAARVAASLGFHLLDSGALYRLTALAAMQQGVDFDDESALARVARALEVQFTDEPRISLRGVDVTDALRAEAVGNAASRIAVLHDVRAALVQRQRDFWQLPGLVADGRDMGTVIFPEAQLKVYLTASVEARAQRRYKQLIEKGFSATMESLSADLRDRDARDMNRLEAPLRPAQDSYQLDSSDLSIDEVVTQVLRWWQQVKPAAQGRKLL
ncbi:MAG: (d)CMP kinase [Burkholderiales bacterium]|jgi:cytidylate kinase|nr:(d)CMP kinase [Burkholderiales bacterium]